MIYFDKPTQYGILRRFVPLLHPDGLMFAGHSEKFMHAADLFRSLGRTVYERADARQDKAAAPGQLAGNQYFDRIFGCEAVKVLPGEYFASDRGMVLVTVLGSCGCLYPRSRATHRRDESFHVAAERERRVGAAVSVGALWCACNAIVAGAARPAGASR